MTSFEQLLEIVKTLRGPQGCPWDKEQTHQSLTPFAIEEAYELEEAILNQDEDNLKEELGDLLFQSVLHAEIARQEGRFDIGDVLDHLNAKMVRRHPHVFAKTEVRDSAEVMRNWEQIKAQEKSQKPEKTKIPTNLPSLLRAEKIGKMTRKEGFDWSAPGDVLAKVQEELQELQVALQNQSQVEMEEELGDLLFSCAQLARHLKISPDKALRKANHKFLRRWEAMHKKRVDFASLTETEKEALWQQVKMEEQKILAK